MNKFHNYSEKKSSHIILDKSKNKIYISSNKFNSPSNISNYSQMNGNSKKYYKLKLKLNFILIAVINIILYLIYKRAKKSNDKYDNNKNKIMKHAILLLSSYGINYMNNVLSQFNNDQRFDII